MDARDSLIVRQVAFKGAIDVIVAKMTETDKADFIVTSVKYLTNEFEKIITKEA